MELIPAPAVSIGKKPGCGLPQRSQLVSLNKGEIDPVGRELNIQRVRGQIPLGGD
jgi:hypothetical protein